MFFAYFIQDNEGCDYSICCGEELVELSAQTYEEAIKQLKKEIIGNYDKMERTFNGIYWDIDERLKQAFLLEVKSKEELPVKQWYKEADDTCTDLNVRSEEDEERKLYERLKQKYDKGA